MRGDCSIRIGGLGFSPAEIAACAERQGLLSIEIELSASNQCRCADCISKSPKSVLPPEEILGVVDQARALGARRVILVDSDTGPYPQLQQIIENLLRREMQVELFSGDTEITGDLGKYLLDHGINVALQIDQKSAITQLKSAPDMEPQLAVRMPVGSDNIEQIPVQWRWARSNNITPHVQIITPGTDAQLPTPESIRLLSEDLARIDHEEFNLPWPSDPALTGRSCNRHLFATHLTACGNIFPCVGVTIPLGNIRTEPLKEILSLSDVLEDLRDYQNKVKEPCRTCSKSVDCYGCRGSAYQLTGDYLAGDELCWKAESTPIESLPIDVGHIIPHGPSIRMVDQLVQIGERRSSTRFTIPHDSLWIDSNGRLDDTAYIEIIAQSFASSHGFHLTPDERAAHRGLLLGVKDLSITGEARAGDRLLIEIRKLTRFGDFGIVEGEVRHEDGSLIATGQVKVWRPSEETAKAFIP